MIEFMVEMWNVSFEIKNIRKDIFVSMIVAIFFSVVKWDEMDEKFALKVGLRCLIWLL